MYPVDWLPILLVTAIATIFGVIVSFIGAYLAIKCIQRKNRE